MKRLIGWVLIVLAVWFALYPVGVLLKWIGGSMKGITTFEESVGYGVTHAITSTIVALVIAVSLFLWGRSLTRKAKRATRSEPALPPPPNDN